MATAQEVARVAVDVLAAEVARQPDLALGLPTGRTAIPFYAELERRHASGELDLRRARGFNVDELLLPADHAAGFRRYMERHAWGRTGLDPARCDIPDGGAADPLSECRRYDAALAAAGDLDLVFLGLGADGHVAYNLPGQVAESTHVVELPGAVAAALGVPPAARPLRAITVGLGPLRTARRLVVMATSAAKAAAVRALLAGPEDPRWPCTALRGHPALDVVLSPAAAGADG
jgi:glucosamine-6-phosphate deaminase